MRLIDADALTKKLENLWNIHDDQDFCNKDVWRELENAPTIESERNKGEWLWKFADNGWADHICSECGWTKNTDIHVRLGYKYCPNCGADMRGNDERMDQS